MTDRKRITTEILLTAIAPGTTRADRYVVPVLIGIGSAIIGYRLIVGDLVGLLIAITQLLVALVFIVDNPVRRRIAGDQFTRAHALHILLAWLYIAIAIFLTRLIMRAPLEGKASEQTYLLLMLLIAVSWMGIRSFLIQTRAFHHRFSTGVPLWEQVLVATNEIIAAGLMASVSANVLVRVFQPRVFTLQWDIVYTGGLLAVTWLYYLGIQMMWEQRWNDWLSRSRVWVRLARVFTPLGLLVVTLLIYRRFLERGDARTAGLLGNADLDLAALAIAPVIWLLMFVLLVIVAISHRGLRERFLPAYLLERLPARLEKLLGTISDMDILLILGVLSTFIPAYLLLLSDSGGVIGLLRQQILQRGGALIETSEQALALLFALPFYAVIVALLALYGLALSRNTLPADERETLVQQLPIGFLIVLIITLYLFAIPFSQVLTEGRLPELPQDLGRILAFNIVIPLLLLYAHYYVLIRSPYARGQKQWRERHSLVLSQELGTIQQNIRLLSHQITAIDAVWQGNTTQVDPQHMDTLFHYVQLNSRRDDLNMQRLRLLDDRQQLTEISETPVSVVVARLPVRIVSIGIPILLAIQIYQWAILNDGLRRIIDDPNLTIFDFFRAILRQTQF